MKRSKDWAVVELRKGLAVDKCSMCHADLEGQSHIFKSTNPRGKKVRTELRCWRCVRSAEGAYLFVTEFPGVFETYRDGHGVHLWPSPPLQLLLDPCEIDLKADDELVDARLRAWKGEK